MVNVERKKPWHTLTGRMQFFLDHDWIAEYGEWLPAYRPPLDYARHFGPEGLADDGRPEITVRYITPHSKWSIHSEYQDNLHMLRLFRGGPVIWMSPEDAAAIGVADNDWIEAYNRNGVVACRAVVSHRIAALVFPPLLRKFKMPLPPCPKPWAWADTMVYTITITILCTPAGQPGPHLGSTELVARVLCSPRLASPIWTMTDAERLGSPDRGCAHPARLRDRHSGSPADRQPDPLPNRPLKLVFTPGQTGSNDSGTAIGRRWR